MIRIVPCVSSFKGFGLSTPNLSTSLPGPLHPLGSSIPTDSPHHYNIFTSRKFLARCRSVALVPCTPLQVKMLTKSKLGKSGNALQMRFKCVALERKASMKLGLEIAKSKLTASFKFSLSAALKALCIWHLDHPTNPAAETITNGNLITFLIVINILLLHLQSWILLSLSTHIRFTSASII